MKLLKSGRALSVKLFVISEIVLPLSKIKAGSLQGSLILVVDALDEGENDDILVTLQLFTEAKKSLGDIRLRVFLTSRPETPICLGFNAMPEIAHYDLVLYGIPGRQSTMTLESC
jgi:hypothetical protein